MHPTYGNGIFQMVFGENSSGFFCVLTSDKSLVKVEGHTVSKHQICPHYSVLRDREQEELGVFNFFF